METRYGSVDSRILKIGDKWPVVYAKVGPGLKMGVNRAQSISKCGSYKNVFSVANSSSVFTDNYEYIQKITTKYFHFS